MPPLAAVHRLADLGQLALRFEHGRRDPRCPAKSPRTISSAAVIAPLVRIADLVHHAVQLGQGLLSWSRRPSRGAGGCPPPWPSGSRLVIASARAFTSGPKVRRTNSWPSASPRSRSTYSHAALPARLHLLARRAGSGCRNRNSACDERRGKIAGLGVHQVPAQVDLPIGQAARFQQRVQLLVERRLA